MDNKRLPMRTCVACKSCKPKAELIRIVKFNDEFDIDFTGKHNGRGMYICDSHECFEKLYKSKLLNKNFKQNVPQEVYDKIKEKYLERKQN